MMQEALNHCLRQVSGEELGHAKSTDTIGAENLGHLLVGGEELLVLGVLQIVLLEVSPKKLDAFRTASFLLANDVGEISAELHGFGKSGSFRHFDNYFFWNYLAVKLLSLTLSVCGMSVALFFLNLVGCAGQGDSRRYRCPGVPRMPEAVRVTADCHVLP